jgi:hypothetical protein
MVVRKYDTLNAQQQIYMKEAGRTKRLWFWAEQTRHGND